MELEEKKQQIVKEHLPYEIEMLICSYIKYFNYKNLDQFLLYLIIESFCIHARNLSEFLYTKRSRTTKGTGRISALDFGKDYQPQNESTLEKFNTLLNQSCSHLDYERVNNKKMTLEKAQKIFPFLKEDLKEFYAKCAPQYKTNELESVINLLDKATS